jgi:hypothetical protein
MADALAMLSALPPAYMSWVTRGSGARAGCILAVAPVLLDRSQGNARSDIEIVRWFIEEGEAGIPLTEKFNLSRSFIRKADDRFPWLRSEMRRHFELQRDTDLPEIVAVRQLASRMGAIRRLRRTLRATYRGRRLLSSPDALWESASEAMVAGDAFEVEAGEVLLAVLLAHYPDGAVSRAVGQLVGEVLSEGWQMPSVDVYGEMNYPAADWAVRDHLTLWETLSLLESKEGPPSDETLSLTEAGYAMAAEVLRRRAASST